MHTRDYSEDTSKIIDDEVERILRAEEQRAMDVLSKHRGGLNAIARALLDNEIIDGAEVARLVDEAHGSPVHDEGAKSVPHFHEAAISAPVGNGANGSGNGDAPHADAGTHADRRHPQRRPSGARRAGAPGPPGRARGVASPALAPAGQPRDRRPGGTRRPLRPRRPAAGTGGSNRSGRRGVMKGDGGAPARRLARGGLRRLLPHRLPDPGQPGRRRGGRAGRLPAGLALPRLALGRAEHPALALPGRRQLVLLQAAPRDPPPRPPRR